MITVNSWKWIKGNGLKNIYRKLPKQLKLLIDFFSRKRHHKNILQVLDNNCEIVIDSFFFSFPKIFTDKKHFIVFLEINLDNEKVYVEIFNFDDDTSNNISHINLN